MLTRLFQRWARPGSQRAATAPAPSPEAAGFEAAPSPPREAVEPVDTAAVAPPDELETARLALRRSLQWRSRVLIEGTADLGERLADGPLVVSAIRNDSEGVIRQIPFAAQQALAVSRNPNSSVGDLVALFERDPTLAQSLLRTANSSWYGRSDEPVISIAAGVQRIGHQAVESVLLASIVHGMLCRPGVRYARMAEQVWAHMSRTAPLAQWLAPAFGVDAEKAYTLALLHDVGKLVAFDYISVLRGNLHREVRMADDFLGQLLMRLHEPLGGLAALRWGLGAEAARALACHHRSPAPGVVDPLTELLYVAERVDLAVNARNGKLDWEAIWAEGRITADRATAEARYAAGRD